LGKAYTYLSDRPSVRHTVCREPRSPPAMSSRVKSKREQEDELSEAVARKLDSEMKRHRREQDQLSEAVARELDGEMTRDKRHEEQLNEMAARQLEREIKAQQLAADARLSRQLSQQFHRDERLLMPESPTLYVPLDCGPSGRYPEPSRGRPSSLDLNELLDAEFAAGITWSPVRAVFRSPTRISSASRSRSRRGGRLSPALRRAARGGAVDVDELSYEELQALCERNGDVKDKAADVAVVSQLPTTSFKGGEEASCLICLEPFRKRQVIKTLPCFHQFHAKEIDKWLRLNNSCPVCKSRVDAKNLPPVT